LSVPYLIVQNEASNAMHIVCQRYTQHFDVF